MPQTRLIGACSGRVGHLFVLHFFFFFVVVGDKKEERRKEGLTDLRR